MIANEKKKILLNQRNGIHTNYSPTPLCVNITAALFFHGP